MRMPLPWHCASMKFGLESFTANPSMIRRVLYKVSPQYQRAFAARIIAGPAPDLAKARACVKTARRRVLLVDFQEHGAEPKPGEATQMQIEHSARKATSLPCARRFDREDFGVI